MNINGINHITISIIDIEESFLFYKDMLGFKPIMKSGFSAYFLCGKMWIALQQEPNVQRINEMYSHIAFNTPKKIFNEMISRLKKNGVREWKDNSTEGESFYFLDPSGNKFELHYSTLKNRLKSAKKEWKDVTFFM